MTFFVKKEYVAVLAEERGRDSYVCRLCGNSCLQWYVGLLTSVVCGREKVLTYILTAEVS